MKLTDTMIDRVGQISLMAVSSLLLFVTANEQSLWLDEVATVSYSDPRLGFAYRDAQMPLIYVLIFISRVVFGSYEIAYRLPILLLAYGMVQFIPWILKREGVNPITAWIAPYLLLLMPKFIYYSQEVRAWMPMVVCAVVWGTFRHIPGWKGWLLCTVLLQSNTFTAIYVVMVVAIDWGYAFWKKNEMPVRAPIIALLTHIPSVVWMLYTLGFFQISFSTRGEFKIQELLTRILEVKHTVAYISESFHFFFDGLIVVWVGIASFSAICLFWKSTPFKRFWLGIILGLIVNAKFFEISVPFLGYTGFVFKAPRYLILMLPLFCIVPFLFPWKSKIISTGVALAMILAAHLTLSIDFKETVAKIDRQYKSKPWEGLAPQLFFRTSNVLIHSKRNDWKHLTLLLNAVVKPGETVLFRDCKGCYVFPLRFYHRDFDKNIDVHFTQDSQGCSNWIVSSYPLRSDKRCGLSLISRLDRFFVYGNKEIILQRPILYSRQFELN